jgi:hypothetical protein
MLYEILHTRQFPGEAPYRWFWDDFFDLIVWLSASQAIIGFQLVYDKRRSPRALTWRQDVGYGHHRVDDGETRPGKPKAAPILLLDGPFDPQGIGEAFAHASAHMDTAIAQFVRQKIVAYSRPTPWSVGRSLENMEMLGIIDERR